MKLNEEFPAALRQAARALHGAAAARRQRGQRSGSLSHRAGAPSTRESSYDDFLLPGRPRGASPRRGC
jgi:hypothetical protein